ncbi:MAG: NAD-dependent epimerase/dehydratase family protein [Proteobacteria bacterium]|nr:NAD-dependent epimerase/dehydratase family protein [Pseudomonadota bacterium]
MTRSIELADLEDASCLIVGGGGFLGTHLCQALTKAKAKVCVFSRTITPIPDWQNVNAVQGTLENTELLRTAIKDSEFVFHLLGGVSPASVDSSLKLEIDHSVSASIRLFEMCCEYNVRRVIFVSSGGTVYGIPKSVPISEEAPTFPISPYGVNKLSIEKYLHYFWKSAGLDYAVMRVANPFGSFQVPGRGQGVIATMLKNAIDGKALEIWGDGKAIRDYIYAPDAARALALAAVYQGAERIFNVGSGLGRSVVDIATDILRLVDRDGFPVVYKDARPTDVPANVLDISRIHREFNWTPKTPWDQALRETANWVRGC